MLEAEKLNRGSKLGLETLHYEPCPVVDIHKEYNVFFCTYQTIGSGSPKGSTKKINSSRSFDEEDFSVHDKEWTDGKPNIIKISTIPVQSS